MVARFGEWIELSFWQTVVRILSTARPLSHGLIQAKTLVEAQPAMAFLPQGWVIAVSGWALGLVLGIGLAWWLL
ncbi:MAG: hypothetical protein WD751_10665 [Anaerolineales bacterium]